MPKHNCCKLLVPKHNCWILLVPKHNCWILLVPKHNCCILLVPKHNCCILLYVLVPKHRVEIDYAVNYTMSLYWHNKSNTVCLPSKAGFYVLFWTTYFTLFFSDISVSQLYNSTVSQFCSNNVVFFIFLNTIFLELNWNLIFKSIVSV